VSLHRGLGRLLRVGPLGLTLRILKLARKHSVDKGYFFDDVGVTLAVGVAIASEHNAHETLTGRVTRFF
jgi:hypothetical protein